jgi:hypothetical protein
MKNNSARADNFCMFYPAFHSLHVISYDTGSISHHDSEQVQVTHDSAVYLHTKEMTQKQSWVT